MRLLVLMACVPPRTVLDGLIAERQIFIFDELVVCCKVDDAVLHIKRATPYILKARSM